MGSTGSGSFSDYSGYRKDKASQNDETQGGSSGNDTCLRAFSTALEDVANCDYYQIQHRVPPVNTPVLVVFNERVVAVTEENLIIGYLPTKFNYLRACMEDGFTYTGLVQSSSVSLLPSVFIDVAPV